MSGFLAPYWRALRGVLTPREVDACTIPQIAALLDLDEQPPEPPARSAPGIRRII